MTAAAATDSAVTWSDAVLLLLTAASVVVATVALGHARRATAAAAKAALEAADANGLAKEANKIALGGNAIAERAAVEAAEANRVAAESNVIAERAAQDARDAPNEVAWEALVTALAAVQTFHVSGPEDAGPLLTAMRTRMMLLVDRAPWEGLGAWLAAEHAAGVALMREAYERGNAERHRRPGRGLTAQQAVDLDERFAQWVAALTNNVRLARLEGPPSDAFAALTEHAQGVLRAVCARNHWSVPTGKMGGLELLSTDEA